MAIHPIGILLLATCVTAIASQSGERADKGWSNENFKPRRSSKSLASNQQFSPRDGRDTNFEESTAPEEEIDYTVDDTIDDNTKDIKKISSDILGKLERKFILKKKENPGEVYLADGYSYTGYGRDGEKLYSKTSLHKHRAREPQLEQLEAERQAAREKQARLARKLNQAENLLKFLRSNIQGGTDREPRRQTTRPRSGGRSASFSQSNKPKRFHKPSFTLDETNGGDFFRGVPGPEALTVRRRPSMPKAPSSGFEDSRERRLELSREPKLIEISEESVESTVSRDRDQSSRHNACRHQRSSAEMDFDHDHSSSGHSTRKRPSSRSEGEEGAGELSQTFGDASDPEATETRTGFEDPDFTEPTRKRKKGRRKKKGKTAEEPAADGETQMTETPEPPATEPVQEVAAEPPATEPVQAVASEKENEVSVTSEQPEGTTTSDQPEENTKRPRKSKRKRRRKKKSKDLEETPKEASETEIPSETPAEEEPSQKKKRRRKSRRRRKKLKEEPGVDPEAKDPAAEAQPGETDPKVDTGSLDPEPEANLVEEPKAESAGLPETNNPETEAQPAAAEPKPETTADQEPKSDPQTEAQPEKSPAENAEPTNNDQGTEVKEPTQDETTRSKRSQFLIGEMKRLMGLHELLEFQKAVTPERVPTKRTVSGPPPGVRRFTAYPHLTQKKFA